jgi:hypothetical protein
MALNVSDCKLRFASPYKGLRSKTKSGKLCQNEAWEARPNGGRGPLGPKHIQSLGDTWAFYKF